MLVYQRVKQMINRESLIININIWELIMTMANINNGSSSS